jgi:hypothetical protein
MFSPSVINVLPFHPHHGSGHARQYVGKYAAKPEKYFFLDTSANGVRQFLKGRTIGVCMAINRLLGFRVVRSTKPVVCTSVCFAPPSWSRIQRDSAHRQMNFDYPDTEYYLTNTQK